MWFDVRRNKQASATGHTPNARATINLRFVEAFYWVASLESTSLAAEKLLPTQSAMSSRISTLEEELGVLLLDRGDKPFKLTAASARFLIYAEKLLALQREVKAEMAYSPPLAANEPSEALLPSLGKHRHPHRPAALLRLK